MMGQAPGDDFHFGVEVRTAHDVLPLVGVEGEECIECGSVECQSVGVAERSVGKCFAQWFICIMLFEEADDVVIRR